MADFILSANRLAENERRGGSSTGDPTTLNLRAGIPPQVQGGVRAELVFALD